MSDIISKLEECKMNSDSEIDDEEEKTVTILENTKCQGILSKSSPTPGKSCKNRAKYLQNNKYFCGIHIDKKLAKTILV